MLKRWFGRFLGPDMKAPSRGERPSSDVAQLRNLIASTAPVAREPGYAAGFTAVGDVEVSGMSSGVEVFVPAQDEMPMQMRVGLRESASTRLVGLDGSTGILRAWNWQSGEPVEPALAQTALSAATHLLAKLEARRDAWVRRLDRTAAERIVRAFFAPWPQSLAAALTTFERQLGPAPMRSPVELDSADPGVKFWLAVFGAGHGTGLCLVDFVREADPRWIADRLREQPEPPQAASFRAARESRLRPGDLAAAMDAHLAAVGWRLMMFDVMYGKPMPAALASEVLADASAAQLAGQLRIALGEEAFRISPPTADES